MSHGHATRNSAAERSILDVLHQLQLDFGLRVYVAAGFKRELQPGTGQNTAGFVFFGGFS
jgi:hypothetical protein